MAFFGDKYILNFNYRNKEYVKSVVNDNYDFYTGKLIDGVLVYNKIMHIDSIDTYIEKRNFYEIDSKFIEDKSIIDPIIEGNCGSSDKSIYIVGNFKFMNNVTNQFFNKLLNKKFIHNYFQLLEIDNLIDNLAITNDIINFLKDEFNMNQTNFFLHDSLNILKKIDFRNLFNINIDSSSIDNNNNYIFNFIKLLDINERLFLYQNNKGLTLSIKYEDIKKNIEKKAHYKILEKIINNNFDDIKNIYSTSLCNTISSLYIGSYLSNDGIKNKAEGFNLFLMPGTSGNLEQLYLNNFKWKINTTSNSKLSEFFIKLLDQIICLYDKKLYYWNMDIKNILYLCEKNIETCKFMFGNLGSLNLFYGTYNVWPYYYQDNNAEFIYKKANLEEKSKYLAYIFIISIMVPCLFYKEKNLTYSDEEKEVLIQIGTFLKNNIIRIINSKSKNIFNKYIDRHNEYFDLDKTNDVDLIRSARYQNILDTCKIEKITKTEFPFEINHSDFYSNLITLNQLREYLEKIF